MNDLEIWIKTVLRMLCHNYIREKKLKRESRVRVEMSISIFVPKDYWLVMVRT